MERFIKPTCLAMGLLIVVWSDLISERTRRALEAKRSQGIITGRPPGNIGKSKLDSKVSELMDLLRDRASFESDGPGNWHIHCYARASL